MSGEFIPVDTRTLVTLAKAFQNGDGLDLLFSYGRPIMIFQNAVEELIAGPQGEVFEAWLIANHNRVSVNSFRLDPRNYPNRQIADLAMKAFVYGDAIEGTPLADLVRPEDIEAAKAARASFGSDAKFRMLSDDGGFYNGEVKSQPSTADALSARGQYAAPYEGTGHFLLEQHKFGKLSLDEIDNAFTKIKANAFDGIPNSNGRGKYQKYYLNRQELEAFDPGFLSKLGIDLNQLLPAGVIVGAVEAARQAGIIGDILSFGITAAHASELQEEGKDKEANKVWVQYIFETSGGIAGGFLGILAAGYFLKGAGGFWGPILGAVAGGVAGSFGGAALGGYLYDSFPEVFDPIFEGIYEFADSLVELEVPPTEALARGIIKGFGFDINPAEGSDGEDWIVITGWNEVDAGRGDDVVIGWSPEFLPQGESVDPENPDAETAETDLRMLLDGEEGDDWIISLGGIGAETVGGEGRDFLFNTSLGGQIYGDTKDGTDKEFYSKDDPREHSDVFWYWPGTFIQDARPNDIIQTFGIPLTGGTNVPVLGGDVFSLLAFLGQLTDFRISLDFINPFISYAFSDSGQLFIHNRLPGAAIATTRTLEDGTEISVDPRLSRVQVVENYDRGAVNDTYFNRNDPGDLGLTFRIWGGTNVPVLGGDVFSGLPAANDNSHNSFHVYIAT